MGIFLTSWDLFFSPPAFSKPVTTLQHHLKMGTAVNPQMLLGFDGSQEAFSTLWVEAGGVGMPHGGTTSTGGWSCV